MKIDAPIHVHRDGVTLGPFSIEEVIANTSNGELSESDLVWDEDANQWILIRDILPRNSHEQFGSLPPPISAAANPSAIRKPVHQLSPKPRTSKKQLRTPKALILTFLACVVVCILIALLDYFSANSVNSNNNTIAQSEAIPVDESKAIISFLDANPDFLPFEVQVTQRQENALDANGKQILLVQGEKLRLLAYNSNGIKAMRSDNKIIIAPFMGTNLMEVAQKLSQQVDPNSLVGEWIVTSSSHQESKHEHSGLGHFFLKMTYTLTMDVMADGTFIMDIDTVSQSNTADIRYVTNDETKSRSKGTWEITSPTLLTCKDSSFENWKNGEWEEDANFSQNGSETYELACGREMVQHIKFPFPTLNPNADLEDMDVSNNTVNVTLLFARQDATGIKLSNQIVQQDIDDFHELLRRLTIATNNIKSSKTLDMPTEDQIQDTFKGLEWGDYKVEAEATLNRIYSLLNTGDQKVPSPLVKRAEFFFSYEQPLLVERTTTVIDNLVQEENASLKSGDIRSAYLLNRQILAAEENQASAASCLQNVQDLDSSKPLDEIVSSLQGLTSAESQSSSSEKEFYSRELDIILAFQPQVNTLHDSFQTAMNNDDATQLKHIGEQAEAIKSIYPALGVVSKIEDAANSLINDQQQFDSALGQAQSYFTAGDIDKAEDFIQSAVALRPKSSKAVDLQKAINQQLIKQSFDSAQKYFADGDYKSASLSAEQVLEFDPTNSQASSLLLKIKKRAAVAFDSAQQEQNTRTNTDNEGTNSTVKSTPVENQVAVVDFVQVSSDMHNEAGDTNPFLPGLQAFRNAQSRGTIRVRGVVKDIGYGAYETTWGSVNLVDNRHNPKYQLMVKFDDSHPKPQWITAGSEVVVEGELLTVSPLGMGGPHGLFNFVLTNSKFYNPKDAQ